MFRKSIQDDEIARMDIPDRKLSSSLTFFYKFIFPTVFIGVWASVTVTLFMDPKAANSSTDTHNPALAFLFVLIAVTLLFYFTCIPLKSARLEGDELVFSNYLKTIRVPLKQVDNVSASLFMNPELIWITFRQTTDFGSKIMFMPPPRFHFGFTRHPMAAELQAMVDKAKRGG